MASTQTDSCEMQQLQQNSDTEYESDDTDSVNQISKHAVIKNESDNRNCMRWILITLVTLFVLLLSVILILYINQTEIKRIRIKKGK